MQSIVNAAQAESTAQLPALQRIRKPNGLTVAGNSLQFVGNALQVIAGAEGSIGMRTRRFPAMKAFVSIFWRFRKLLCRSMPNTIIYACTYIFEWIFSNNTDR